MNKNAVFSAGEAGNTEQCSLEERQGGQCSAVKAGMEDSVLQCTYTVH
jgi:hypothetical protein